MKTCLLTVLFLVFLTSIAIAGLKIERVFQKDDYFYVLATYTNDTNKTFKVVRIKCKALSSSGTMIDINTRSFFDHDIGPIEPGFSDTLKIPIELHGNNGHSASCTVSAI